MWVKTLKPAKRQVEKAAKIAGFCVVSSGKTSTGASYYTIHSNSQNPNLETLKALLASAGVFDASWM